MQHTEIKLTINKQLKDLLPPLTKEEYEQLEANILADGVVRDPILFWENGTDENVIVDGMNRYAIATKHNIPFLTVSKDFESIEAVELWMLDNALGRRNLLSPQSQRKIRGEMYNRMKREDAGHGDQKSECQNVTPIPAAEIVAEKSGVSDRTVKRDGKYVEALDSLPKSIRDAVGAGTCKATDAEVLKLAKADQSKQMEVARNVRTGTVRLGAAMAAAGVRSAPKENGKPRAKQGQAVVSGAKLVDQLTRAHVGNMVRGIDAIAKANGGKGPVHKLANDSLETFIKCLKKMRAGEK